MSEPMKLKYTPEQFQKLLNQFQSAVDSGEYTEKIPYETWRKLKKLYHPKIEYISPFVKIYEVVPNIDGVDRDVIMFSAKIYDWGFGRFFYDYVIKKERDNMTLNSATSAVSACDAIDATKISALESKADYTSYADVAYATSLTGTGKATCEYNGYTYSGADSISTAKIAEPNRVNTIELNIPSLDHFGYHQIDGTWDSVASKSEMEDRFKKLEAELQKKVDKAEKNKCENKENETMMKGFNFDFGPCGNTVRLSMYGLAVQNVSGEWVSYNTTTKEIMNVDIINMADGGKYIYKMPVAISEVQVGDIIVHAKVPMFVTGINNDGSFNAIDVRAGEAKCILATRSPFGFNFVTKVVNLFGNMLGTPTADQPFGNMLPFLMLNGENKDIDPMMMFFLMGQNGNTSINPMMWYFLSKDNKNMDPAMMWMVMSMAGGATPGFMAQPHTCKCHQKVSDEQI